MNIGTNLAAALLKVQKEIDSVEKLGENPHFKSKFAELSDVIDALKPILNKHGILFLQVPVVPTFEGTLALSTILVHVDSGEAVEATAEVPLAKADPQAYGSAVTYTRRYSLVSILGLKTVDDDGNAASSAPRAKQEAPANPGGFSFKKSAPKESTLVEDLQSTVPVEPSVKKKTTSLFPKVKA